MNMEGVLLVDKPIGPSSFDVVRKVRALSGIKRVGHAGTLDPLASGLMVVALGRYTKLTGHLTESDKGYEAIIELGISTTTDDAEGQIIEQRAIAHLSEEEVVSVCQSFCGPLAQKPPKFSAIKIGGRRAYSMARALEDFEIKSREVEIYSLEITAISLPLISIKVHCSKGTYIRALARDIGECLGVGAYARAIRRFKSGSFRAEASINLQDLTKESLASNLKRGRAAMGGLAIVDLGELDTKNALHGRPLSLSAPYDHSFVGFHGDDPIAVLAMEGSVARTLRVI